MKILLKSNKGASYAWVTAKYDNGAFVVNGESQDYRNVMAVINDNRKKYVQCSSCKKVFRKGDKKHFAEHCAKAASPETCFNCPRLYADTKSHIKRNFAVNADCTFTEFAENRVVLQCSQYGMWSYADIDSDEALTKCPMRKCKKAHEEEIHDLFTDYPGVFDDMATIDKILSVGYKDKFHDSPYTGYHLNTDIEAIDIYAYVNKMGIIESFLVYYHSDDYRLYYSKRYNKLFVYSSKKGSYIEFDYIDEDDINAICKAIAKLYN